MTCPACEFAKEQPDHFEFAQGCEQCCEQCCARAIACTTVIRSDLAADGWRWRLIAKNGKTVADSGEAYVRKRNAVNAAMSLVSAVMRLDVQDTPPPKPPRRVKGKFAPAKKARA